MRKAFVVVLVGSTQLSACDWSDALRSDASAWSPPRSAAAPPAMAAQPEGGQPGGSEPEECSEEPAFEAGLERSFATRLSHGAGTPCLTGCHELGGTARLTFAAAGTAYSAQGERIIAPAGRTLHGIGGTELAVDACGNFYAIEEALTAPVGRTQPWVKEPTFRRMEKPLSREARPGDCNQSGCHDFSDRLNAGIYF